MNAMKADKRIVQELLGLCGVAVDGPNPWDLRVKDDRFYARVLGEKSLGLGDSYMDGWWECERIDELICRILRAGVEKRVRGNPRLALAAVAAAVRNRQTLARARIVAERHYDTGNDLFFSFLDPYKQYSCAYFNGDDALEAAQVNKMELIRRKLQIKEGDRVLDIGSGWGGLAKYLAENCDCRVTGINISEEQIAYSKEWCRGLPVEIRRCDYREVDGVYDKIVSVGMFEHVGRKNYRVFMKTVHDRLSDEGVFLLHTIGRNVSRRTGTDPWIEKHIFPNGELPSLAQIMRAVEGLFVVEDTHNLGPHYDRTLMAWHERFQRAWPSLKDKYDGRFKRMWEYYLLCCAGAFRARDIQVWQIVCVKPGTSQPCRCV
jgi:cyclopropane-fatty-acyl-phospholipid synthase